MEKILVLNPGSTSTKLALYEGTTQLFLESITHRPEELAPYDTVADQFGFRAELVRACLERHGVALTDLSAIACRGGVLKPIHAGAYEVNETMVQYLRHPTRPEHASNLAALIGYELGHKAGIPVYIYDGVTVDEMTPINQITGLPGMRWKGMGHNLNTRAAALRYAADRGVDYNDITVIVAHLGGGITVNLHNKGRIEDFINDEAGPFSPERSGVLPLFDVISMCFEEGATKKSVTKRCKSQGGLMGHLGTTDSREVERRIAEGDEKAKLVYDAMALTTAKNIAKTAPCVNGKVDAIVLTGGIAYSKYFTEEISKRVSFIAPVVVYPGENEMDALAGGILRVLHGEEKAETYTAE